MKHQLSYLTLAVSALLLSACGGDMLGTSDAEDHKLIPNPVDEDYSRLRPSENIPVIKADERELLDAAGEPLLLRGVNLLYGDDPIERLVSITPIAEVDANVVRIVLRADTTVQDLEAALVQAVENDLIAIVSLWEPELYCIDNAPLFFSSFDQLWLGRWWPVLIQDRFQSHIMINPFSGWGPNNIFNAHSVGYRIYIDNYKALIGQLRRYGVRVPIVVDAPGCGRDYHAFLGNRGRELLAADSQKNLVLSVHAYGPHWRRGQRVADNMTLLAGERMPVLVSEFSDYRATEDGIVHMELLEKGAGDRAVSLNIDWQSDSDQAGYLIELAEPISVLAREISVDIYLDAAYVSDDVPMGIQVYIRDSDGRYANLGWNNASGMTPNGWTRLGRAIIDASSFGWGDPEFDLDAVTQIGIDIVANGKPVDVRGDIRLDNFKIIEASVPELQQTLTFDGGIDGWAGAGWMNTDVVHEDGVLGLIISDQDGGEILAFSPSLPGLSYAGNVQIKADVLIPESYDISGIWFQFVSNSNGWANTGAANASDFIPGEWTEITLAGDWNTGGSDIGIQAGNLANSSDPILVNNIRIYAVPEAAGAVEWGIQYQTDFSADTDGWGVLGWHTLPVTVSAANGELVLLPRPSETTPDDDNRITFAVQKSGLGQVENFNLNTEAMSMHFTIHLDAAYANVPDDFEVRLFMQDSNWQNHFNIGVWTKEDLTPGEWVSIDVDVDFPADFSRSGIPQHFGFQVFGVQGIPNSPIRISEFRIEGDVPLEQLEEVVDIADFHYYEQDLARLSVDIAEGGLSDVVLAEALEAFQRLRPFHWVASHWIGSPEGSEVLDLSESADTSVSLTERGEEIVNGKGGLQETSVPAASP